MLSIDSFLSILYPMAAITTMSAPETLYNEQLGAAACHMPSLVEVTKNQPRTMLAPLGALFT